MAILTGWEVANNVGVVGDISNNEYTGAMSFQLSKDATILSAEVHFDAFVNSPVGNMWSYIETDNAGVPSGSLVDANASVQIIPVASQWNVSTYPGSFALSASTTYWLRVHPDQVQSNTAYFGVKTDNTEGYTSGSWFNSINAGAYTDTDNDLNFRINGSFLRDPKGQSIIIR